MKSNDREKKTEQKAEQAGSTLNDRAWEQLFEKYNIKERVEQEGFFEITANQIKEFREPRLMTKFDTAESLPKCFGKGKKLSILPNSRGTYVIGYFHTYCELPEMDRRIKHVDFPSHLQTISKNNINSEANVINVLGITNILGDFLSEQDVVQTISGRMKSGLFDFKIRDTKRQNLVDISVKNAQIEIDAGFESRDSVIIMEAKNVVHKDFIVRQLYYPYRLWKDKVSKNVRTVFMVYSNNVFRLIEYCFKDPYDYSSIAFVRQKNYSFEDVDIKMEDLLDVYSNTEPKSEPTGVPFIQADNFNTVISLLEIVKEEPKSVIGLSEIIGFADRQGDYYYNAAKYLGLAEKEKGNDGIVRVKLSLEGERILNLPYKERQLAYITKMFGHKIFRDTFFESYVQQHIIDKKRIVEKMRELNLCGDSLLDRRASSVSGWLKWIFSIVNE